MSIRTDLALEAKDFFCSSNKSKEINGVISENKSIDGFEVMTVKIIDENGEKAIGKPKGNYVTFEADPFLLREKSSFERACNVLKRIIREMIQNNSKGEILVAGLGNIDITSDALGPLTVKNTVITRHLVERVPEHFGTMRPVAALAPGVLSVTGMETEEIIGSVLKDKNFSAIIVVDALASRSLDRLCRTVQISDTGIVPGSGVGNHRNALNRETLGVPVIAVGVPTVVYAGTLAYDIISKANIEVDDEILTRYSGDIIVTPRDIDENIRDMAKLIGYGINLALQDLTVDDINMFLS